MASAIYRWWMMIHNGGTPTVIAPPITGDVLQETTSLSALLETTTGIELTESV